MEVEKTWGKIQIYTGNGKGKTTAALGLGIRAAGRSKKVAIIYFDKGGDNYGERRILDQLKGKIDYFVFGRNRIDPITNKFEFGVKEIDKEEAQKALMLAKQFLIEQAYDLLILDEVNPSLALGMFEVADLLAVLGAKTPTTELVLTGRQAAAEILAKADLVTEMTLVKHYFYSGTGAREGIEY
ncbi:MAG: cob(I)yrinic acid a,c-diamide adenosyltransferase [Candidatus Komeilibacteria bacterium]|nr:cob(I)yrinic acid a,c-diamide adenosyltransferase [Candidatus Komeilibacteria bacterium]